MFTGIVEAVGEVISFERESQAVARLVLLAPSIAGDVRTGESISVNGCCLTLTEPHAREFRFDLLDETLQRTNLGALGVGDPVNLERALAANGRLGGHFVQGHIDCAAAVRSFEKVGADYRLEVDLPAEFAGCVVSKGSVALNGVSLTVAEVSDESFVVWLIPHTLAVTNLRTLAADQLVNFEADILAKYVQRLISR